MTSDASWRQSYRPTLYTAHKNCFGDDVPYKLVFYLHTYSYLGNKRLLIRITNYIFRFFVFFLLLSPNEGRYDFTRVCLSVCALDYSKVINGFCMMCGNLVD